MAQVHKTVIVGHTAEQMFLLVDKVEDYPRFLPWCSAVLIEERAKNQLTATISMAFHGLSYSFTTQNINHYPDKIEMVLVKGPFKKLEGKWLFTALAKDACKVTLDLHYVFASSVLEKLIGPMFDKIAHNLIDAFCKRAEVVYGGNE